MMLHQDGSRAVWLAGQPPLDLIVTMDDATSTTYSAFLVEEEGTASTFRGLLEVFESKGLPSSLYTDRGSHYFVTVMRSIGLDRRRSDWPCDSSASRTLRPTRRRPGDARSACSARSRTG